MRARRIVLPIVVASLLSGACRAAHNYLDRSGPRYAGGPVTADASSHEARRELKVVTFNIRYAREVERAIDLLRLTEVLSEADVIALQEMDGAGVQRMAEALGLAYVYYPAAVHSGGGKDFGNAVLVRGEILEDRKIMLPHPGRFGGMQRIAVAVTARLGGRRLRIYSTHLGTPKELSSSARRDQVAAIVEDAAATDDLVVVAGDFNNRGAVAAAFNSAGFVWLTRDVGRTISLFSWDHVFVRGFPATDSRSGAVDSRGASDHRAVWVDLPLEPASPTALPAGPREAVSPAGALGREPSLNTARQSETLPIR